jgi:hypothetical protein
MSNSILLDVPPMSEGVITDGELLRRMRGSGAAVKGVLWSMRDLKVGV